MTDHVAADVRRRIMGAVRSRNSGPELLIRSAAHRLGFRFRVHREDLPGTPDLAFPKWRTVVFVHGCFWHRHPGCPKAGTPKSNVEFWKAKFAANVARDERNVRDLEALGWDIAIVWQCHARNLDSATSALIAALPPRMTAHLDDHGRAR
ncbi:MAG: DNA mismatch endonuclease Vsr [Chromatiales bacterium]|nr:DNA mismatch endonuclease Vsr [Chromatiales bacterium]